MMNFSASGTPALTSRGFVEEDFVKVAEFFDAAVRLAVKIKGQTKGVCCCIMISFLSEPEFNYCLVLVLILLLGASFMIILFKPRRLVCYWVLCDSLLGSTVLSKCNNILEVIYVMSYC
mgnify:CR=1 FL=1